MQKIISNSIDCPLMDSENIAKMITDYIEMKYIFVVSVSGEDYRDEYFSTESIVLAATYEEAFDIINNYSHHPDANCSGFVDFNWFMEKVKKYNTPFNCESKLIYFSFCNDIFTFTHCIYYWHNPSQPLTTSSYKLINDVKATNIKKYINPKKCFTAKPKYYTSCKYDH